MDDILITWLGVCLLANVALCIPINEDYYTSLIGVQELAQQEQIIIQSVVDYRILLIERLKIVDNYLEEYRKSLEPLTTSERYPGLKRTIKKSKYKSFVPIFEDKKDLIDLAEYTSSHPVLAYKLIRRLAHQLPLLVDNLSNCIEQDFFSVNFEMTNKLRLPSEEDMKGAADGLLRVQFTYSIPIEKFISGEYGPKESRILVEINSSWDLHYIGMNAFKGKHYSYSVQWLEKALDKSPDNIKEIQDHFVEAIKMHNEGLTHVDNEFFERLFFEKPLNTNLTRLKVPQNFKLPTSYVINYKEESWRDISNFQALCSGIDLLDSKTRKELYCYYKKDTPLTFLSPLKVEIHLKSPQILQFYDILGESSISLIKNISAPFLLRAKISGSLEEQNIKSDIRTSSVTWISESRSNLSKIPEKIKDITGLDALAGFAAEDLQVSCYSSIGGHYQPHFDSLFDEKIGPHLPPHEKLRGDRLATIMFYLSDVEFGGSTAFPRLGIASKAVKGSAIFWFNLLSNGKRDLRSLHGGCPIGKGIKWVANKWIRTDQQMFNHPCKLNDFV